MPGTPPMLEPLTLPFMQRALAAGVLVGFLASYYGVFVVQRRQAFLGSGLGHAAFGGIGLGVLLGIEPIWVALPYTVAAAIAIVLVERRTALATDTVIGIFFAVSMSIGVLCLALKEGFSGEAYTYLFGSILYTTPADLITALAVSLATLAAAPYWKRWAYATFDPNLARADRIPVLKDDLLLAAAIAVAIAVSIKIVGILLIAAFLVLPAATARLAARTFANMTQWAVAIGITTALAGLLLSYHFNLPSGPTIILLQAALFFITMLCARGKH